MLNIAETNKRNYFKNLYDRIATHLVIKYDKLQKEKPKQ